VKAGAHCTTDDFGVPEVNSARHRDGGSGTERGSGSHDGADVSGILHGVEDDDARDRCDLEGFERVRRNGRDGKDALRRVGLGGAGEFLRGHVGDLDATPPKVGEERGAARRLGELRRDEHTVDPKRGSSELLDGAHSFGGEEALALARLPAPEIAS
jgi:hypothetical protein